MKIVKNNKYFRDAKVNDIIGYHNNEIDEHCEYKIIEIRKIIQTNGISMTLVNASVYEVEVLYYLDIDQNEADSRTFIRSSDYNWYIK